MSRRRNNNRKQNTNVNTTDNTPVSVNNKEQEQVVVVMRVCNVGEVNVNGSRYTVDSYKKALEEFNSKVSRSEIFFGPANPYNEFDYKRFRTVNPDNCCADIVEIKDDCVVYKVPNKDMYDIIKKAVEKGTANVQLRYFGSFIKQEFDNVKLYMINRIVSFDIMLKDEYPFKNYIEFISQNTDEKG